MKQLFITARKRSFGQGNVFTPACLFTGGGLPAGGLHIRGALHPGGLGRPPPQTRKAGGMHPTVTFFFVTARKRSLGQGNMFTPVCHSVHGRGVPGPVGCLVPGGCLVWGGAWSGGVPGGDLPRTATAVGGTHPNGMHSCFY